MGSCRREYVATTESKVPAGRHGFWFDRQYIHVQYMLAGSSFLRPSLRRLGMAGRHLGHSESSIYSAHFGAQRKAGARTQRAQQHGEWVWSALERLQRIHGARRSLSRLGKKMRHGVRNDMGGSLGGGRGRLGRKGRNKGWGKRGVSRRQARFARRAHAMLVCPVCSGIEVRGEITAPSGRIVLWLLYGRGVQPKEQAKAKYGQKKEAQDDKKWEFAMRRVSTVIGPPPVGQRKHSG